MTLEQASAFAVFALVAALTPGPSNVMLAATGTVAGLAGGLPCLAGVAAGMGVLMFSVAMGLGQLVNGIPAVLSLLNGVGAALLLWLAWKIATAGRRDEPPAGKAVGFRAAAAFQLVNPKSWLVSASAAGTYLQADGQSPALQAMIFAGLFVGVALPCGLCWLVFGAALQRLLRGRPRAARVFNIAMGLGLAASVVLIIR